MRLSTIVGKVKDIEKQLEVHEAVKFQLEIN